MMRAGAPVRCHVESTVSPPLIAREQHEPKVCYMKHSGKCMCKLAIVGYVFVCVCVLYVQQQQQQIALCNSE